MDTATGINIFHMIEPLWILASFATSLLAGYFAYSVIEWLFNAAILPLITQKLRRAEPHPLLLTTLAAASFALCSIITFNVGIIQNMTWTYGPPLEGTVDLLHRISGAAAFHPSDYIWVYLYSVWPYAVFVGFLLGFLLAYPRLHRFLRPVAIVGGIYATYRILAVVAGYSMPLPYPDFFFIIDKVVFWAMGIIGVAGVLSIFANAFLRRKLTYVREPLPAGRKRKPIFQLAVVALFVTFAIVLFVVEKNSELRCALQEETFPILDLPQAKIPLLENMQPGNLLSLKTDKNGKPNDEKPRELLKDVVAISSGQKRSVALKRDGTVWEWFSLSDFNPKKVDSLPRIVAVSTGVAHTLALGEDGMVYSWGKNDKGQLGIGSYDNSQAPVCVKRINKVVRISAAGDVSLALRIDGSLFYWGKLSGYQDIQEFKGLSSPRKFERANDIVAINAGDNICWALCSKGIPYVNNYSFEGDCWFLARWFREVQRITHWVAFPVYWNRNGDLMTESRWGHNREKLAEDVVIALPIDASVYFTHSDGSLWWLGRPYNESTDRYITGKPHLVKGIKDVITLAAREECLFVLVKDDG